MLLRHLLEVETRRERTSLMCVDDVPLRGVSARLHVRPHPRVVSGFIRVDAALVCVDDCCVPRTLFGRDIL